MATSSKDSKTDLLAREVVRLTGGSLTEAIRNALIERLERERTRRRLRDNLVDEYECDRPALRFVA